MSMKLYQWIARQCLSAVVRLALETVIVEGLLLIPGLSEAMSSFELGLGKMSVLTPYISTWPLQIGEHPGLQQRLSEIHGSGLNSGFVPCFWGQAAVRRIM